MTSKECTKCGITKDYSEFYKDTKAKSGLFPKCKECFKEYYEANKEKRAEYLEANKEKIAVRRSKYASANKEKIAKYREDNKEKIAESSAKYYEANKEKIAERGVKNRNRRMKEDAVFRLTRILRCRTYHAFKNGYGTKAFKTKELLGCEWEVAKEHIEAQFTEGMSWDLLGKIHLDHIRPVSSFDLTDPEQQKACFHYTNLQPLWAKDNMAKGSSYQH